MKKVLIYCRESRDDGFSHYERIETQRDILMRFCEKKKLGEIVAVILDDNKSGASFERLEPVKERIRAGDVDVFLLKDASRLGRNILESLVFTEFLAEHHVELVFESESYDEDIFPLIAWFNERRAKDDSLKIRRVLRHKMEEGAMVIQAPYGFEKRGASLIVIPEQAAVVKEIFALFIVGQSKAEIANTLNLRGIPTPSRAKGRARASETWNAQHIARILSHIAYTGDMPYGMRRKVSYKSKKYASVPQSEWIIQKDRHEAVVPRETFAQAQALLHRQRKLEVVQ